jgi:signal transduction histidine kinase
VRSASSQSGAARALWESDPQFTEGGRKVRSLLLVSFGCLLALLIGAGLDALRSIRQLDSVEEQAAKQFSVRNQALSTIIVSVHVYDDQLRRYLLQDEPPGENPTAEDIARKIAQVRAALFNYPSADSADVQQLLEQMRQQILQQENSFADVQSWQPRSRQQRAHQFIGDTLLPWRAQVLELSQQLSSANGKMLDRQNHLLAARFQHLEARLVWLVALAITAGLLISLVCGWYILRLERQGRQRYQALARSRRELEGLSARLVEAQEQERRSISRELHDEVGQTLGALLVEVGQLSKVVPPEDRVAQAQITHIKSVAETAVKAVRDIALLLRPPMLDDLGLVPALEWQAREISRRSDMEVDVHSEQVSEALPDEIKVCVYRLVQEALNNAASHASTKTAKVTVTQASDKINVEIADNGSGFDAVRSRGMGILGMEERVKRLGGTLTIDSGPGRGTTVKAELPLHPQPAVASPAPSAA